MMLLLLTYQSAESQEEHRDAVCDGVIEEESGGCGGDQCG